MCLPQHDEYRIQIGYVLGWDFNRSQYVQTYVTNSMKPATDLLCVVLFSASAICVPFQAHINKSRPSWKLSVPWDKTLFRYTLVH